MALMVKCKGCGNDFESDYQMADTSFWHKPNSMISIKLGCPKCGKNDVYKKKDHFFQ